MTNNNDLLAQADRSMDLAVRYGVREENPLWMAEATHENIDYSEGDVPLSDRRLVRIVRLRLLGDSDGFMYPYLDVSYCYGQLADGRYVRVDLGVYSFPKKGLKAALVACAKEAGRFGKGMGLLDDTTISRLY